MKFVTDSRAEAEEFRDTLDKARGFPPGGFPPDQEWARVRGIGATVHQCDLEPEPEGSRFALEIPEDADELVEKGIAKGWVTAEEKGRVDSSKSKRRHGLPQDWSKSTSPINGGGGGKGDSGNGGSGGKGRAR